VDCGIRIKKREKRKEKREKGEGRREVRQ